MKKGSSKIWFTFDMKTPGAIFIKLVEPLVPHIDVKHIGNELIRHAKETGEANCRFVCRLMPVDILCKANCFDDFKRFAKPALDKALLEHRNSVEDKEKPILWCLEMKRRNNEKIPKKDYLDFLCAEIDNGKNPVSYDYADIEVVVEVFRDLLILSILPGYKRDFKKYNL